MKKNLKKIILLILILILISGIIMVSIVGFNKSLEYSKVTRIEVYIPKGYEKTDIINFAKESFGGKTFTFEEVEKLNQVASIRIKDYTTEELDSFKEKISQKYDIKKDSLQIYEIKVPETRIRSLVQPYILPISLVTGITLIYIIARNYNSKNKIKIILKVLLTLVLTLGIYFSLIVITRIPFGTYTMPIALAIYIITLLISTNNIKEK